METLLYSLFKSVFSLSWHACPLVSSVDVIMPFDFKFTLNHFNNSCYWNSLYRFDRHLEDNCVLCQWLKIMANNPDIFRLWVTISPIYQSLWSTFGAVLLCLAFPKNILCIPHFNGSICYHLDGFCSPRALELHGNVITLPSGNGKPPFVTNYLSLRRSNALRLKFISRLGISLSA